MKAAVTLSLSYEWCEGHHRNYERKQIPLDGTRRSPS